MPASWPAPLPDASYLLLTTLREDGRAVLTPVWSRPGPVPGGPPVEAHSDLLEDELAARRLRRHVGRRYPVAYALWTSVVRVVGRASGCTRSASA